MNWEEYDKCLDEMAEWVLDNFYNMNLQQLEVGAIYGVPRGGLPMAVSLSHILGVPMILDYHTQYPPTGDLLVVDKSLNPKNFSTVIANVHDELVVKSFVKEGDKQFLTSGSKKFEDRILINEEADVFVWGVVTYVIHSVY